MADAYVCDAVRTPIGSYGGGLSGIRTDDLAALPIKALFKKFLRSDILIIFISMLKLTFHLFPDHVF